MTRLTTPLKNAPHTHVELTSNKWDHKYEREEAAYPSEFLRTNKYWPPVGRVDNVYGDKNLFCTCPSMGRVRRHSSLNICQDENCCSRCRYIRIECCLLPIQKT